MSTIHDIVSNPDFSEKHILQKLLCHYLDCSRETLWLQPDQELAPEITDKVIQ